MSAGYGPPVVNTFGMITGLGDAIGKSYDAARKQAQEDEAPALISKLVGMQTADTAAPGATLGTMGQSYREGGPKLPSFAATGGGMGDYLRTVSGVESGGSDTAKNPASTATGRYQFTQQTWNGLAKKYPDLGLTPNGRTDPAQQDRAMQAFTKDNADALTRAGVPITPGNLYVSHFLGEAGGPRFIAGAMSNPDAPATQFVTPGAAAANRTIFYNRDGSPKSAAEVYAERTGRFGGGGGPTQTPTLPTQVASADRTMVLPGAPAAAPVTMAQAPLPQMGAAPMARVATPSTVAQGDPDAANKPAPNAQPAGFVIPGQDAPAAPAPSPQGFPGFGTAASRISPAQQEILTAAWKNPVTRPMATQIYGELLKGQSSPWKLQQMGNQPVLVNERTAQIVPVGQAKRDTATVGNVVIDTATGQPIYQGERDPKTATVGNTIVDLRTGQPLYQGAEKPIAVGGALVSSDGKVVYEGKDDKFTYQSMPGVGMVALHPTDPDKSRVIIQGQQPRPLTADERAAYQIPAGTGGGMGSDNKPFTLGGSGTKTEVNVDMKGAGKFTEKANEIQAKRYGDMVEAADNAVPLKADIEVMAGLGAQISTGKLAEARLGMAQYAKAAGLDSIASSLTNGKMGEMEAFTALADKLTPRMRVPGSGSTSDAEGRAFKNSLPSLLKSPEGNAIIADTFRGLADYQTQAGEIAGKALRGEISQSEADQALRGLPSPYSRFKAYQGGQGGQGAAADASPAPLPKGKDRVEIPGGVSAGVAIAQAKKAVAAGKDKAAIAERLRSWGIDPKRLDE